MKYLECAQITELDVELQSGIDVGDYCVQGRLEIYSCKLASSEKRLASSLDKQLVQDLGAAEAEGWNQSISPASASPLGSVNEVHTRKLLINMILTLNNTFADYDFRDLKPEDFVREASMEMVMNSVNSKMSRVDDATNSEFCTRLWGALTDEMSLRECEIYSYVADLDDDALSIGKIWSVNYFFYNKRLKKLAFFACWVKSKSRSRSMEGMEDGDELDMDSDGEMEFDMEDQ
mmetsp:Transcript_1214/g.2359  ORF Transcript_1214/g.2359 Transcript_1214/m.2359 type:complete len:233 (+) Transcript_1214:79-777(+)